MENKNLIGNSNKMPFDVDANIIQMTTNNEAYNKLSKESKDSLTMKSLEDEINLKKQLRDTALAQQTANVETNRAIETIDSLQHIKGIHHTTAKIKTPTSETTISSTNSTRCYVATSTYQNAHHPNVVILRDFRDTYLSKSLLGRLFISFYYVVGKYLAILPEHFICIRELSKSLLDVVVKLIIKKFYC